MKNFIFLSVESGPIERVELDEKAVVTDLLRQLEGERSIDVTDLLVFGEDEDEPLEPRAPVHGKGNPVFHAHRCRHVEIEVHYGLETFKRRFAPSATIAKVTRWAIHEAKLGPEEAQEHVLQVHGTKIQPPLSAHLGSLAGKTCSVEFDLVRKKLVQG